MGAPGPHGDTKAVAAVVVVNGEGEEEEEEEEEEAKVTGSFPGPLGVGIGEGEASRVKAERSLDGRRDAGELTGHYRTWKEREGKGGKKKIKIANEEEGASDESDTDALETRDELQASLDRMGGNSALSCFADNLVGRVGIEERFKTTVDLQER
ncbi:hypothetical protein BJ684DRAFT_16380 [Piptocephalis cylindrospora]|uniref:Uncharacterized protein n=1 Tax=Piptocephalis cylindrospora TaxID=1907219 RepID=A0A4P9Y335_9FUNG|nr:hypothetical protein BJ684DRAFT_16380 [Piptocephalis cylindrospora]|eukprot:RKP13203.1 hypothetical protein BJ684DRAFT_16380 [Piptocephalis cylindrospora]